MPAKKLKIMEKRNIFLGKEYLGKRKYSWKRKIFLGQETDSEGKLNNPGKRNIFLGKGKYQWEKENIPVKPVKNNNFRKRNL